MDSKKVKMTKYHRIYLIINPV